MGNLFYDEPRVTVVKTVHRWKVGDVLYKRDNPGWRLTVIRVSHCGNLPEYDCSTVPPQINYPHILEHTLVLCGYKTEEEHGNG